MGTVHAKALNENSEEINRNKLFELPTEVKKVNIEGLRRTKDDVVIDSVRDLFGASNFQSTIIKIHEAKERLEKLKCFNNVSIFIDTFDNASNDQGIEVTFNVEELKLLGSQVQAEVGNNEGSLTTGGVLRNVFGRGENLSAMYSHSSNKTSSFFSTFSKPFHNKYQSSFSTQIFQQASQAPWSGYKQTDIGTILSVDAYSGDIKHKFSWNGVWRNLSCLSGATDFAVREESGHTLKSSLTYQLTKDTRDDPIFPTDGTLFNVKNEIAGLGGDMKFAKTELDFQLNVPLWRNLVVQGVLQAGDMTSLGEGKCHSIADRFILGGSTSLRGFEQAGVGPHSQACALGAQTFWASALHLYSPMPLLEPGGQIARKFRLHGFVNIGNIGNFIKKDSEMVSKLLQDMRLSYGAGIAMNLAGLARVELNYCVPLVFQRGDKPKQGFQFGVSANVF